MASSPHTPLPPITSAPSTPRRSHAQIDKRFELTPRSKIATMLAAFDSGDEDDIGASQRANKQAGDKDIVMSNEEDEEDEMPLVRAGRRARVVKRIEVDGEQQKDEEEVLPWIPRGIAGQMEVDDEDEDKDEDGDQNVFLRKPRGIAGRMEIDGPEAEDEDSPLPNGNRELEEQEDEEEPLAPRQRNRIHKPSHSIRPSPPRTKNNKLPFSQNNSDEEDSPEQKPPFFPITNVNAGEGLDSDPEAQRELHKNARIQELVERKRRERQEKEAVEAQRLAERRARAKQLNTENQGDEEDSSSDGDASRALELSQMRPRRSAGKKAMAEMARETQRMARNMQLVHEARTKVKIRKENLFAKFGFRPQKADVVKEEKKDTLPETVEKVKENGDGNSEEKSPTDELPSNQELLKAFDVAPTITPHSGKYKPSSRQSTPPRHLDKGKGRAIDPPTPKHIKGLKLPPVSVKFPKNPPTTDNSDSEDSEFEILSSNIPCAPTTNNTAAQTQKDRYAALQARKLAALEEQARQKKGRELAAKEAAILELRKRSGNTTAIPITSSNKVKGKKTAKDLAVELLQKSRHQAAQEREERIAELKAKGVIVMTAEERAKDMATIEEQMEKARLEAERIKKREQKQDRLEKIRKGEMDVYDGEESDEEEEEDGDWLEEEQGPLYELSGSEGEMLEDLEDEEEAGSAAGSAVAYFSDDENEEDAEEEEGEGEGAGEDMAEEGLQSPRVRSGFILNEAEEDDTDTDMTRVQQPRRKHRIIHDDEDEENQDEMDVDIDPSEAESKDPFVSLSGTASKNPFAAFPGLGSESMPLGLTQMFMGTIGNYSQDAEPFTLSRKSQPGQSKLDILRKPIIDALPNSQAPLAFDINDEEKVKDIQSMQVDLQYEQSQTPPPSDSEDGLEDENKENNDMSQAASFPRVNLNFTQSQILTDEDSYNSHLSTPDFSQFPDSTLDGGLNASPIKEIPRFDPTQTQVVATQASEQATQFLSPQLSMKPRRILRKADVAAEDDTTEEEVEDESNAFAMMRKAARATRRRQELEEFDKKKSEAKKMVQEQAEESEDEWAGIGGADDEDEDEDEEEVRAEMQDMIDDTTKNIDQNAVKAWYAEQEREEDERQVTKIFKDLQNGGFRRKRNAADFDLSDSEDEEERRRAVKRRNEARLRKLLLEDTNISQIAANPKRTAFLDCLQDNDKDDSAMFLDQVEDDLFPSPGLDTPANENEKGNMVEEQPSLQRADANISQSNNDEFAAGPKLPRSRISGATRRKNPGLAEIREQLSFLIEEDDKPTLGLSESDDDDDDYENDKNDSNDDDSQKRKTIINKRRVRTTTVIDRISLKRTATLSSVTHSSTTKLAFHAPDTSGDPTGFNVPGLLRRATNNSQLSTDSSSVTSADTGVVVTGGKKGGASTAINYHQREREVQRGRVVEKEQEKRRSKLLKESQRRAAAAAAVVAGKEPGGGVVGLLAKGSFS